MKWIALILATSLIGCQAHDPQSNLAAPAEKKGELDELDTNEDLSTALSNVDFDSWAFGDEEEQDESDQGWVDQCVNRLIYDEKITTRGTAVALDFSVAVNPETCPEEYKNRNAEEIPMALQARISMFISCKDVDLSELEGKTIRDEFDLISDRCGDVSTVQYRSRSTFDLEYEISNDLYGISGRLSGEALHVAADGQPCSWDQTNGYWTTQDCRLVRSDYVTSWKVNNGDDLEIEKPKNTKTTVDLKNVRTKTGNRSYEGEAPLTINGWSGTIQLDGAKSGEWTLRKGNQTETGVVSLD